MAGIPVILSGFNSDENPMRQNMTRKRTGSNPAPLSLYFSLPPSLWAGEAVGRAPPPGLRLLPSHSIWGEGVAAPPCTVMTTAPDLPIQQRAALLPLPP